MGEKWQTGKDLKLTRRAKSEKKAVFSRISERAETGGAEHLMLLAIHLTFSQFLTFSSSGKGIPGTNPELSTSALDFFST